METFNFPYHKQSVEYPESGFRLELGNSYTYNAAPSAPDQRLFRLSFETMRFYEAGYFKQSPIPLVAEEGDVWVDTGSRNALIWSRDIASGQWTKQGTTVSTGHSDSDGTALARKISETNDNSSHRIYPFAPLPVVAGTRYTFSASLRLGTVSACQLILGASGFPLTAYANFQLSGGILGSKGSTATSGIIEETNGYYRCWMSDVATATVTEYPNIFFTNNSAVSVRAPSYAGFTGRDLYVYAPQFEENPSPGRRILTQASPVSTIGNNKAYRKAGNLWVPSTNSSKLNLLKDPLMNMGLLEDFYLQHKLWKKFIYPHPLYGDLAVRFNKPLSIPKGMMDANGLIEGFELELIEVPGGL